MRLPPLNALKSFEASARCGSFVLAAEELGVTAAAVSMQVRKLELFFGKTLFTRGHNHIALTDAGMTIYRDSASALNQLSTLTSKLLGDRDRRPLCVSVLPALAERWLASRVADWDAPLRIRVEDDPVELIRDGVDIRVTYGDHFYPGHHATVLMHESIVPVISTKIALDNLSLKSLPEELFIHVDWGERYMDHLGWNDWFREAGIARDISPARGKRVANTSLAMALAEQGVGVALTQGGFAQDAEYEGRLRIAHSTALPLLRPYCAISRDAPAAQGELLRLIDLLLQKPRRVRSCSFSRSGRRLA
ncbi:LysR family transcriptional regulator [Granulosicoccus antarcticus]|uniref:Glycine cleavage system transcriptional activator n=1 Tax=Granulosicoccus antarcticus IMCC3135 TaxID=1192854 RepID=A0A2Z2P3N6_9GAMM|nr:LysR substrate-binding domain-containing protein [Granulosicoccus antarcticus]ASJ74414.1 Glycine cleavage system transcriptional activator [Granulosicoccus antarcticus IMCC3135]